MEAKSVKYWFISLKSGTETVKAFRGKAKLVDGLWNILLSHFVLAVLMLALILSAMSNNGQDTMAHLFWPVGLLVVGIVSWLTRSYVYHMTASLLGGKGDYTNYARLISFPMAGALVVGTGLMVVFLLSFFDLTVMYLLLIIIPLVSIIQITEREYGLSRSKAIAAVIIPTVLMIVLSVVFSEYGIAII